MIKLFLFCFFSFSAIAWGQGTPTTSSPPKVETTWPGIEMQVHKMEHIPGNRLLVTISLVAKPNAPSTLIGIPPPKPPPNASQAELEIYEGYTPAPFSISSATMIDERTQQEYHTVNPAPKGPLYRSDSVMGSLSSGQFLLLAVQFPVPPPPPPDENGHIPKQMVSFFLPNTNGPIVHVVIPPPTAPTPAISQ